MKKKMARSVMLAFGASIFLFSEQVFANTVIYDPLDPQNTITPVPNEEHEDQISDSLTNEVVIDSSTTETSTANTATSKALKFSEDEQNTRDQDSKDSRSLEPNIQPKKMKAANEFPAVSPYVPKMKKTPKNQVLVLNDDFFSQLGTIDVPPDGSSGSAGSPNEFADIAQSAYLLSGIVLYGEANGKLEARASDYFAG
ncbi:hypothetical protein [Enterococcus malodoratus]|uniref:hypothetical protein n=1 Tax=Enterococcus malodoratus TaxID=71451 RepID=UPI0039AF8FD1